MPYGTIYSDTVQGSVAATAPVFSDGNGTQVGQLTKAWGNHSGGAPPTTRASFNISSITRTATGSYTMVFTIAVSDSNFAVAGGSDGSGMTYSPATTVSTTSFTSIVGRASEGNYDRTYVHFVVNR